MGPGDFLYDILVAIIASVGAGLGITKFILDYGYYKEPVVKIDFFPEIEGKILKSNYRQIGDIIVSNKGNMDTYVYFRLTNTQGKISLKIKNIEDKKELPFDCIKVNKNSSENLVYEIIPKEDLPIRCDNISFEIRGPGVGRTLFKKRGKISKIFTIIFEKSTPKPK